MTLQKLMIVLRPDTSEPFVLVLGYFFTYKKQVSSKSGFASTHYLYSLTKAIPDLEETFKFVK